MTLVNGLRFGANLSMLYTDRPLLDRFLAAERDGFSHVEFWYPYEEKISKLAKIVSRTKLSVTVINTPPGDVNNGDWGLAAVPGREHEFRDGFRRALEYAEAVSAKYIHVMAGNAPPENESVYLSSLEFCLGEIASSQVRILIEPLNPIDRPEYHLVDIARADSIVREFSTQSLRIMFDFYHVQRAAGSALADCISCWDHIGHMQIASAPERREPDRGWIDYMKVFNEMKRRSWQEPIGCEYFPSCVERPSFHWMSDLTSDQEGVLAC